MFVDRKKMLELISKTVAIPAKQVFFPKKKKRFS
jgi:hypothetical protein